MSGLRAMLLVLLALTLTGCFKDSYRAQWRQKMVVLVDSPEGEKRGESVIAVNFARGNERLMRATDGSGVRWYVRGEAAVVDLGGGRYLFALLKGAGSYLGNAGVNAYVFSSRKYAPGEIEAIKAVENARRNKPKRLPRGMYPLLVTFGDINDPKTVKKVDPDNLAAAFGPGYRLKSITLEITDEPVTRGKVEKVLGWLPKAEFIIPPSQQPRYVKDQTVEQKLMPSDFIDWRTLKALRERK